jgi:hypothetical protein
MNLISSRAAYALYPDATFSRHISLRMTRDRDRDDFARAKYERRGWTYIKDITHQEITMKSCDLGGDFVSRERWVGDKRTWIIPFENFTGNSSEELIRLNSWKLVYQDASLGLSETTILSSPKLGRQFTVSPDAREMLAQLLKDMPSKSER